MRIALGIAAVAAFVIYCTTLSYQNQVIFQQRALIQKMMRNPDCMVEVPHYTDKKDPVVTEN